MTPDMNWSNIEVAQVNHFCMFNVSNDEELEEGFNWIFKQTLLKKDDQYKETKYN